MPLVDIHTIGAGGGSLAWLEAGGLRVGPQSAGADPGPACYGRGGTEPTVTDANLHLGRLDSGYFLGGRMALDEHAAEKALARIGLQLGLDVAEFAEGVLAIINARMADAMRTITVKQGIDPREYALVAFGGAGPMHAMWLAEELEISEVIVPWSPGTFSAWGMLRTDMRHDVVRSFYRPLADLAEADVAAAIRTLEEEGATLLEHEGIGVDERYSARSADMRYVGQEYTVTVPLQREIRLEEVDTAFHDAHRIRYGHSTPGAPVASHVSPYAAVGAAEDPLVGARRVAFAGTRHETSVLLRERLPVGWRCEGPVVIEEPSSTTIVPPNSDAALDQHGNIVITRA
jgi:N-methylhydantoinase A